MSTKITWLFIFVALYWAYCVFCGIRASRMAKTANAFFIADRGLSTWVFVLAVTAASVAGWIFVGQPGLVFRDGFQYANASLYAIGVPLAGVVLLKRQWMMGKRFGYVTQGEMFADYFQSDVISVVSVGIALLFAVPFLGMLFGASGFLVSELSGGTISRVAGMWVLSSVVLLYVVTGGLRAVANIGVVQCVLFAAGSIVIGLFAFYQVGGFDTLNEGLASLAETSIGRWGTTQGLGGGDYNGYFVVPGVIQWIAGLGKDTPLGGPWTGILGLSYMLALMGIQSAPAFTIWGYASKSTRAFGIQQVWASAFCVGIILLFFSNLQGIAARFLGADAQVNEAGLSVAKLLPELGQGDQAALLVHYISAIGDIAPWAAGFLAVCAIAALQSVAAAFMSTTGSVLASDIYKRYLNPTSDQATLKRAGRVSALLVFLAALLMATFSGDAMVLLGGLAIAFSLQLWPSLLAVIWCPWITRQGATLGLIAGLIAVVMTESIGQRLTGNALPWGRWPWTIHSAGWGIFFNLVICLTVSALTRKDADQPHRMKLHGFLREHCSLPPSKRRLIPLAWVISLVWVFFAVGPGVVLGNDLFGAPGAGYEAWVFNMPSIWVWHILWWALGVGMIWFLAYKMEMSTAPPGEIEPLRHDVELTNMEAMK